MRSWLSKLFERRAERSEPAVTEPRYRVTFDEKSIQVAGPGGATERIFWADLGTVEVVAIRCGTSRLDLLWVLSEKSGRRGPIVPMGAHGERQLIKAMQTRLHGFDNMAVVEAMSSTGEGTFTVWPAADLI